MRHKFLICGVSVVGLLASLGGTAAAHDEGVYIRGNAGYGVHADPELTGGLTSLQHGNGLQSEGNIGASLGLGYEFDNNWRLELDGDTLFTDFGSISQIPNSFGKLRTNSLMLNAIYDFENYGRLEPYVGAGLGFVQGEASFAAHDFAIGSLAVSNPACLAAPGGAVQSCNISDKDSGFGWQVLAGLGYALTDNLTWDNHVTYMDAGSFDLEGVRNTFAPSGNGSTALSSSLSDVGAFTAMTGLRYRFGHDHAAKVAPPPPPPPPPPAPIPEPATFTCWNGTSVLNAANCPAQPAPAPVQTYTCWDGTVVSDLAVCPAQPAPAPVQTFVCADGVTTVSDLAACPVVQATNLNICSDSSVKIFDVPAQTTFKQVPRLGTMPEFGDSHDLSPNQFYDKLAARYNASATDKAYLNYLFRSMGYANGWRDARPDMFSNDVLPVGTRGILGLGEQHHFEYKILPTSDRDRQAFRIQSANGQVVHFMKTCGNYFYGCQ